MFHGYMTNIWGDDYKHPINPMAKDRTLTVVPWSDCFDDEESSNKSKSKKKILPRRTTQESAAKVHPDFYILKEALKHPDPVPKVEPIPQHEDDFDGAYKNQPRNIPGFAIHTNNIATVVDVDQTPCEHCGTLYRVKIMNTIYMTCDCGRTYR